MGDLQIEVEAVEPVAYAASPLLMFKLRIRQNGPEPTSIHAILLHCQIRFEPAKRSYSAEEKQGLRDLFDRPERWGQTLKPMLWTHAHATTPPFTTTIVADLPVPCTYDFNVAATKYFGALESGEAPLTLFFSGTVFQEAEAGLQASQLPWNLEASYRLPIGVWKALMDHYYPNCAWLCLRKDVFDRLHRYKSRHGIPTWETALERLLAEEKP